jgi:FkbM family methyltransferase
VAAATPLKKQIVLVAAALPCGVKRHVARSPLTVKALSSLLFRARNRAPFSIRTNLGISDDLDVELPSTVASPSHLFLTPDRYRGEAGPLLLARQLVRHCAAFIDVGANVGYYTLFVRANSRSDVMIYYFEPDPSLADLIASNLTRNRMANVVGFARAIGAASGRSEFFVNLDNRSMSSLFTEYESTHHLQSTTVEVTTFDEFVQASGLPGAYLTKVDVENGEWAFVEGAQRALRSMPFLILEILGPARRRGLVDHLIRRFGFHCYYIDGLVLEHLGEDDGRYHPGEWNFLFCRDDPERLRERIEPGPLRVA